MHSVVKYDLCKNNAQKVLESENILFKGIDNQVGFFIHYTDSSRQLMLLLLLIPT